MAFKKSNPLSWTLRNTPTYLKLTSYFVWKSAKWMVVEGKKTVPLWNIEQNQKILQNMWKPKQNANLLPWHSCEELEKYLPFLFFIHIVCFKYCFCFLGNQQTLGHKMKTIFLGIDLVVVENEGFHLTQLSWPSVIWKRLQKIQIKWSFTWSE